MSWWRNRDRTPTFCGYDRGNNPRYRPAWWVSLFHADRAWPTKEF